MNYEFVLKGFLLTPAYLNKKYKRCYTEAFVCKFISMFQMFPQKIATVIVLTGMALDN